MTTEKQIKAWQRTHTYDGHGYHVEISNGRVAGYFNSPDGEHVSKFDFEYNPFEKVFKHPDSNLVNHPSDFASWPLESGWLGVLGCDSSFTPVPSFDHPNDLYQWLREEFGYSRTVIIHEV